MSGIDSMEAPASEGTPAEVVTLHAESDSSLPQPSAADRNTVKYFLGGASSPVCSHASSGAYPAIILTILFANAGLSFQTDEGGIILPLGIRCEA